jgi:adenylosuccinate synthase
MQDLLDFDSLSKKISTNLVDINKALIKVHDEEPMDPKGMINELREAVDYVKPYICNTSEMLHDAYTANKPILLEGAQGTLLDVDHGTYPYVTSSCPTAGGACTGSGIPPLAITHVIGITKAYCTRVGNGPFTTELHEEYGEKLRKNGQEFGATTGRPRRCGWLDLVALNYAVRVNGFNELAITKMDVLDDFDEIKVCTQYEIDGEKTKVFPHGAEELEKVTPVYKTFKGWNESTRNISRFADLPVNAREYIQFIEDQTGVPFTIVSTGPKRSESIMK